MSSGRHMEQQTNPVNSDYGNVVSWSDLKTKIWGPPGTPKRDKLDRQAARYLWRERVAWLALRPITAIPGVGMPIAVFWHEVFDQMVEEGSLNARALVDAMAFSHMGDYLFHGRPVTESYHTSPYIRTANRIWAFLSPDGV